MFASSAPDEYGHVHPNETQSLVRSKLEDLELELAKLSKKDAYEQAQTKCPDQLTDAFKLMFLRCEVFDAIVSTWTSHVAAMDASSFDSPQCCADVACSWQRAISSSTGKRGSKSLVRILPFVQ